MTGSDRRRIRNPELTRAAILDAALGLFADGHYYPTSQDIAQRAEVAPRTVFVHFPDLEALATAAASLQAERLRAMAKPVPPDWTFERRVDALIAQRARMYEAMTPVRRGGLVRESESPGLRQVMAAGDDWFRAETAAVFEPELQADPDAASRGGLLDALEAATSWAAWEHLRSRRGLSRAAAARAVKRTVLALLASA